MMNILGIGDHVSCGTALIQNGKLVAAINDERLVREKMVFGVPRESIKMIMQYHALHPHQIDAIAIGTINQHLIDHYIDYREGWFGFQRGKFKQFLFETGSRISKQRYHLPFLDRLYYTLRKPAFAKRRRALRKILKEEFDFTCPVYFLDHHLCHVASAYYTSGYSDATVFSIDGGGDGKSARIYDVRKGIFNELLSIPSFDSLGCFYSYITQLCGFKAGKHEGKITGLAAYGKPVYIPQLRKIMITHEGRVQNIANVFFLSALKELKKLLPDDFSHKDLAASIQTYVEEMTVDLVKYWLEKTKNGHVALAGGLFANVKINQRIHEIPGVESVFVHPGMSDEGIPVGAALQLHYQLSKQKYDEHFPVMNHVYLGPEYDDQEIQNELDRQEVTYQYLDHIEIEIARLLADGAVVARFHGRMEYGPRALGNRSILYQANDPSVNYWLNDALNRTEFMPFAPIVLMEQAEKCFKNLHGASNAARFMTITFDCTDWMIQTCQGVVHVDHTARPQLVGEKDNPGMYSILNEYFKLTGIPCLINTSFNMHEAPIVCTPHDAMLAFKLGRLDFLAIGNFLVKNLNPSERKVNKNKLKDYLGRKGLSVN
ncbi:MAG: hypothetical protein COX20_11355 [Desulfobacterales bacterium CG23_combo_of_CG06-09_8_20_14_all_52_9]|nr:MAG: hypothetical protein COX20_11355 [Desulfobacterales bacterium CG23_combo_of_CG06-09_8_20_14_all_52_9]